jgi:hypothetical protein
MPTPQAKILRQDVAFGNADDGLGPVGLSPRSTGSRCQDDKSAVYISSYIANDEAFRASVGSCNRGRPNRTRVAWLSHFQSL